MQTKFILNGGFNIQSGKENNEFYKEILLDAPESSKVLLVFFAKEDERIADATERVKSEFIKNSGAKKLTFETADKKNFLDQIQATDIIYLAGGKTAKLLETLKGIIGLVESIRGKIVAGESAGANALASYSYSPKAEAILQGLGVLPIKLIPHYKEEYKGVLDSVGRELELVELAEYETKVFFS